MGKKQSVELNKEKLKFIFSGVIDPTLPNRIKRIREQLGIPKSGFGNDTESIKKWWDWADEEGKRHFKEHKIKYEETPRYILKKIIDEIIITYGLDEFGLLEDSVKNYILSGDYGSIHGGFEVKQTIFDISNEKTKGRDMIWEIKFQRNNNPSDKEFLNAIKYIKKIAGIRTSFKPMNNLDKTIKILKKTQKKGTPWIDPITGEKDGDYSDADIVAEINEGKSDKMHTPKMTKRARDMVRNARSRANKRLKMHFPHLFKKQKKS